MKKTTALVLTALTALCGAFGFSSCDVVNDLTGGAFEGLFDGLFGHKHQLEKVEEIPAGCEEVGVAEHWICKDEACGKLYSDAAGEKEITKADTVIAALDHAWAPAWTGAADGHYHECNRCDGTSNVVEHTKTVIGVAVKATCTTDGRTAGEKCSICNYVIAEQQTVKATGHKMTYKAAQAADCDVAGWVAHYNCETCKKSFEDEAGKKELTEVSIAAKQHDWSKWTSNGNDQHVRTCANNAAHVETSDCSGGEATCQEKAVCSACNTVYGKLGNHALDEVNLQYTDGSGHYYKCVATDCDYHTEVVAHKLATQKTDSVHYEECEYCGYKSEEVAHSAKSISAVIVTGNLAEDMVLTAADVKVTALCACGHSYVITEDVEVENKKLSAGETTLKVYYGTLETEVVADATNAPRYTLTLVGATLADGTTTTVELKEGAAIPALMEKGSLLGFKSGNDFYTVEGFKMPAEAIELTALYAEDMPLFAPSDTNGDGAKIGAHETIGGIPTTKITFNAKDQTIKPRPDRDSGETYLNTRAPAVGETFMLVAIVNDNASDYEIRYEAENYGVKGSIVITVKANATTIVPFVYGMEGDNNGSFQGCDNWITMLSDIKENVSLSFYGYLYLESDNAIASISASGIKSEYEEGDVIDLTGLKVSATTVAGHSFNLLSYTCNVKNGQAWEAGIKEIVVSFGEVKSAIKINNIDNWIATSFTKHEDADWLEAEYVAVEGTNLTATKYTFKAGATSGSSANLQTHVDGNNPNTQGYNIRVPYYNGKARTIKVVVTNNGTEAISFHLFASGGANDGVDIALVAGETKTISFDSSMGETIGPWFGIKLLSDVSVDTAVTIYGYFKTYEGEVTSLGINGGSSHKRVFTVGEAFTAKALTVDANNGNGTTGDVNITNFTTDIAEGYVFTADDTGTKTVTVTWNGLTVSYDITVNAAA